MIFQPKIARAAAVSERKEESWHAKKSRIACSLYDWTEALSDGSIEEPSVEFTEAAHIRLSKLLAAPPLADFLESGLGELIYNLRRQRDRRGFHDG